MARRAPGEGTVFKMKDGRYKAVLSLGIVNGKRVRRSKIGKTKADAAALLRTMKAESGAAAVLSTGKMSTADLLKAYETEYVAKQREESTLALFQSIAKTHLVPRLGTVPVDKLSPILLTRLMNELDDDEIGGRARQNCYDWLHKAVNWAIKMGYRSTDPLQGVDRPKHDAKEMRPFDHSQAMKLLQETEGERSHAFLQLAINTGMRQGELFGLEWRRVDFERRTVRVEQAVAQVKGKLYLKKPKTKRSLRTIEIPQNVADSLIAHRAESMRRGLGAVDLVFPAPQGGLESRNNFSKRVWLPLLKRCSFERRGAHNLRHTYATLALRAGVPVHIVSAIMGHARPSITHDIYSHVLPTDQEHSTNAMTRLFG